MTTNESGHLVDEAIIQGAEPFGEVVIGRGDAQQPMETQRWAMPSDLPYSYVEYAGVGMDLQFLMQRHSNIIAAMRKVRDANALPSQAPQTPPQAAQQPQAPQGAVIGPGDTKAWGGNALGNGNYINELIPAMPVAGNPAHQSNAAGQPIQGHAEDGQFMCPEHNVPLRKTSPQYDTTGDKFYHPMPQEEWYQNDRGMTVKNHNLWRSQLVAAGGA